MSRTIIVAAVASALLGGCAAMPSQELSDCLQPNRRVAVEMVGTVLPPPPKPKPAVEGAKPEPKPAADKPEPKPKKPTPVPLQLKAMAQGDAAFDPNSAVLKPTGTAELDQMLAVAAKRNMSIGAVVLAGHTDRFEATSASANLGEERAKAVMSYLVSKGMDPKLMFWEGKGDKEPMPVTKFCE